MSDSVNTISVVVTDNVASTVAPKLIQIAEASEKANASYGALKSQLASVQSSGVASLSSQLNGLQGSLAQTTSATQSLVSANVSAAASMGILEGRTLSMNRAAANFITRTLGLGGILQQAFPVIGAIALVDVLYQMGSALTKVTKNAIDAARNIAKAFEDVIDPLRKSNDELALTNDKVEASIAKLQHRPTTNGVATALDEARVMADKLDDSLDKVNKDLATLLSKNQVSIWGSMLTAQDPTTGTAKFIQQQWDTIQAAQDRAKQSLDSMAGIKDPKAAEAALTQIYKDERTAIQGATQAIIDKYNATKKADDAFTHGTLANGQQGVINQSRSTAKLTELGEAGHLAQQELRNLDLTMSNMVDNKKADTLRDQVSGNSGALKQATKDWKALTSAFEDWKSAQEKSGHIPTAQESLSELQTLGKNNNPLNADKLTTKEEPFQRDIDKDNWLSDQTSKLANQVAEIGLYDNALKEQNMMNTLTQEAQRKGISLTDAQTSAFRQQINTIVESKDYNSELESVYQSVFGSQTSLIASTQAINTLWEQGKLTRDQYNNSMDAAIQKYNDATDAVSKFMREEKEAESTSLSKRGTEGHIAALNSLDSLNAQLRAPGPNRKGEDEIKAIDAALTPLMEAQQHKNAIDQQANALINAQADLTEKLAIKEAALKQAVDAGALSQQAANSARRRDQLTINTQSLAAGTGGNPLKTAVESYSKDFTTLAAAIENTFSKTFSTIADGAADAFGRALVSGKNMGNAMKEVAREAIGELISGLIKLGIQQLINLAEGTAAGAAATASGVAQATTLAAAWSTPAFAASVATLGTADAVGGAAYASGLASALALSSIPKLATGTNSLPGDMLIYAHEGERVVPAADNRDMIAALQGNTRTGGKTHIEIVNNGGGYVETQESSDDHIRFIVHAEAPHLIAKHAPSVIANDIANPNGKTSKAIYRNVISERVR